MKFDLMTSSILFLTIESRMSVSLRNTLYQQISNRMLENIFEKQQTQLFSCLSRKLKNEIR